MKKLKLLDKLIFLVNSIIAALLLLSYLIPLLAPKNFAFISVLSLAVPILIVLNIIFFIYWLIKVKKQLLLSLIVLAIGYKYLGSFYKFSSSEVSQTSHEISIMSYNVRLFNLYNWIDDGDIPNKIENLILEANPDVISLQEYKPNSNVDLSSYPYKFEKLSGKELKIGQIIYSKYPIANSGSVEFPNTHNNAIYADIVVNTDTIRVYNVHLQSLHISADMVRLNTEDSEKIVRQTGETFKIQQEQTELFLKHKNRSSYKTIITGDFNNTPYSYVYRQIKGDYHDAFEFAGKGFGRTFDFKFFPIRIDFILSDKKFDVSYFKTFNQKYSDHYPIMAKLQLH